jgi:hypothetical protein
MATPHLAGTVALSADLQFEIQESGRGKQAAALTRLLTRNASAATPSA